MASRRALCILIVVALLAGCTGVSPGRPTQAPPTPSLVRNAPVSPSVSAAPKQPAPPALPTAAVASPCTETPAAVNGAGPPAGPPGSGVFLITDDICRPEGRVVPLDAATGQDAPGYSPMAGWGATAVASISPDGRSLIASVHDGLHLFPLDRWGEDIALQGPTGKQAYGAIVWSADSSRAVLINADQLWLIDLSRQAVRLLTELDFNIGLAPVFAPDGGTLYLIGQQHAPLDAWPPVQGEPFVASISTTTGQINGRVALSGLQAGPQWGAAPKDGYSSFFVPAIAVAPNGRHFYIAPADGDRLIVIDPERMQIERTADLARRRSAPERLLSGILDRLAGRVEAKGGSEYERQLEVSPDGRRLYLTGMGDSGAGVLPNARTPLSLLMLDAQTLRVLSRQPDIDRILLSPDGSRLFATGQTIEYEGLGAGAYRTVTLPGAGLQLIDARDLHQVAAIKPGGTYQQSALSTDGRYAYLLSLGPGMQTAQVADGKYRCVQPCWQLTVVDAETEQVVAERDLYRLNAQLVAAHSSRLLF